MEIIFLSANLLKVFDGGYLPLTLALCVATCMWTWVRGSELVFEKSHRENIPLNDLIKMLGKSHPVRVGGTAVFLTSDPDIAPSALLHNLKHNNVLHAKNIIMTRACGDDAALSGRPACEDRAAVGRLPPRRADLRLHGDAERAARAGSMPQARHQVRHHGDVVLPQPSLLQAEPAVADADVAEPGCSSR